MDIGPLFDPIVRQTTVLIAQLATSGGERTQLANTANQLFVDLATALREQGLGNQGNRGHVRHGTAHLDSEGAIAVSSDDGAALITRLEPDGTLDYAQDVGTGQFDQIHSLKFDGSGNIVVAGETYGALQGTNAGESDAFPIKFVGATP